MKGIVVKGIGGFYFVDTGDEVFRARGRGILKRNKSLIIVGDEVDATPPLPGDDDGVITEIYPRRNSFSRPPVSNLDMMVVVFSVADPEPNLEVIDRLLVMAESKGIEPAVCINKSDLDDPAGDSVSEVDSVSEGKIEKLRRIYEPIYPTVVTCCKWAAGDAGTSENNNKTVEMDSGLEALKKIIAGRRVALAGPSGVGKSSITNALIPDAGMETGEISGKTQRGKHTTRHVEILKLPNYLDDMDEADGSEGAGGDAGEGSYLYDTPGFTSFDLEDIGEDELGDYFPEIKAASESCKFRDCFHIEEPDCGVKDALAEGKIAQSRYESYLSSLNEIREKNRRLYG